MTSSPEQSPNVPPTPISQRDIVPALIRKYAWLILALWFLASLAGGRHIYALADTGGILGAAAVVLSVVGVLALPIGIVLQNYRRVFEWLLSKQYSWLVLWLTFGAGLAALPFVQRSLSDNGVLATSVLFVVVLCVTVLPLPALLLTWRFVASRVPVQHRWWLLWVWFGGGVIFFWFGRDSKNVLVGIFGTISVLVVPVLATYQTAHRFGMSSEELNQRVEWIMERWGWKLLWFGGGVLALAVAASTVLLGKPSPSHSQAVLPGLTLFGSVSVASLVAVLEGKFWAWAAGDDPSPRASLYPGQFWFAWAAAFAMGALVAAFLAVAFFSAWDLATLIDEERHGILKTVVPWIAGIVFGLYALAISVYVPFAAMFKWFATRRALDRMKTDALLKLAETADKRASG